MSFIICLYRAAFHLNVTTSPLKNAAGENTCHQQVIVCSRYMGSQHQESNMALIEIGFVSGYEVDKSSLNVSLFYLVN